MEQLLTSKYGPILDDFMNEALRIEKAASEIGIPLRIIGCLAFRLKSPEFTRSSGKKLHQINNYLGSNKRRRVLYQNIPISPTKFYMLSCLGKNCYILLNYLYGSQNKPTQIIRLTPTGFDDG